MQTAHVKNVLEEEQAGEIAQLKQDHELKRAAQQHHYEMQIRRDAADFEEAMERRKRVQQAAFDREELEFQRQMEERTQEFDARLRASDDERQIELEQKRERWKAVQAELGQMRDFDREKERGQLFLKAWESGSAAVLAAYLGRNPDDAKEFITLIINHQAAGEERKALILKDMIEKNLIIEADLDGVSRELIRAVAGIVSRPEDWPFLLKKTTETTFDALADKKDAAIADKPAEAENTKENEEEDVADV